jgi:hypothetical protein
LGKQLVFGQSLTFTYQNPLQLAFAAVGLPALWLVMAFVSAIRD